MFTLNCIDDGLSLDCVPRKCRLVFSADFPRGVQTKGQLSERSTEPGGKMPDLGKPHPLSKTQELQTYVARTENGLAAPNMSQRQISLANIYYLRGST
jgi:hypothetical protein